MAATAAANVMVRAALRTPSSLIQCLGAAYWYGGPSGGSSETADRRSGEVGKTCRAGRRDAGLPLGASARSLDRQAPRDRLAVAGAVARGHRRGQLHAALARERVAGALVQPQRHRLGRTGVDARGLGRDNAAARASGAASTVQRFSPCRHLTCSLTTPPFDARTLRFTRLTETAFATVVPPPAGGGVVRSATATASATAGRRTAAIVNRRLPRRRCRPCRPRARRRCARRRRGRRTPSGSCTRRTRRRRGCTPSA